MHLHRNVTVCQKKSTSYAEIVKGNSSERREENKEPLDTEYKKNDEFTARVQENVLLGKVCTDNEDEYTNTK